MRFVLRKLEKFVKCINYIGKSWCRIFGRHLLGRCVAAEEFVCLKFGLTKATSVLVCLGGQRIELRMSKNLRQIRTT